MKTSDTLDTVAMTEAAPLARFKTVASRRAGRFNALAANALPGLVVKTPAPAARPDAFEFNALSDAVLLGWLTGAGHRPNVLIECSPLSVETAMRHLMTWCALPFRYCALPGALELPRPARGTLLLKEVGSLTLAQQVALYDWLTAYHGQAQVISLTTVSLSRLVEDGEFLEGLLYRLNVVRLDGMSGTRPAPLDAWASTRTERPA